MKEQKKIINPKKKPMKGWKKLVLFLVAQVMLVTAVLLAYNYVAGMQIRIETVDGTYGYSLDPFEKKEDFFESSIFERIFQSAMQEITEYSVVCHQLETEGVFDGKKEIDITEYANRKSGMNNEDVTAVFYLEDLLKWSKYGMNYQQQEVRVDNYSESFNYYYDVTEDDTENTAELRIETARVEETYTVYTEQSVSANDLGDADGFYTPSVWMKQSIDYYTPYANFNEIWQDEEGRFWGNLYILQCRYKTVDGKNLEELVNNWQDYFTLVHNLDSAIADLNINYQIYQTLSEKYGEGKSNLKFCVRMGEGSEAEYLSNLPELDGKALSEKQVSDIFMEEYDKYLYYSPSDMTYLTNTIIQEDVIFDMLTRRYLQYAYPESSKLWVGIDRNFQVEDDFSKVFTVYEQSNGTSLQGLIAAFVLLLAYGILMVFLCCKAGWERNEEGEVILKLNAFDRIHTEFVVVFSLFLTWIGCYLWNVSLDVYNAADYLMHQGIRWGANLLIGAEVLITGAVFGILFLSLVRRIKGQNLFSDSLVAAVSHAVREKWIESIQGNRSRTKQYWVLYLGYLVLNFVLVALGCYIVINRGHIRFLGVFVWLLALAFDLFTGFGLIRNISERYKIIAGINRIRDGEISYQVTEEMHGENRILADAVNNIGDGIRKAVETSMKDERLKADLITNVSHDIKTPLTSIINYVDLLKREDIQDEKLKGYIEILDSKSQRLKQLTEDLVEASKISSGNVSYVFEKINLAELINQAIGEFSEKFEAKGLAVVDNLAGQSAYIEADSRRMWRVIENLFNNAYKYALSNTRIYLTMGEETVGGQDFVSLTIKNISAQPLNIDASELTERFIRGDVSRSTEGSGLGLSIAKNLTEAQHGKFDIYLDGDLFKVTLRFPLI